VACAVQFLVLMYDAAQQIVFRKQSNRKGNSNPIAPLDFYAWERAVHGGTSTSPWTCIRPSNIHHSEFCWRFGVSNCKYQRWSSKGFGPPSSGIWSPVEKPQLFTAEELRRVPDTKLRFVVYTGLECDTSESRGFLDNDLRQIARRQGPSRDDDDEDEGENAATTIRLRRVASAPVMFWNMIHEGLVFLSLLVNGRIYWNRDTWAPVVFRASEPIVASMFYANDVLVCFSSCLIHVLKSPSLLRQYGLPEDHDYLEGWTYGTPEIISGDSVLLSQTGILARDEGGADLDGNPSDEGRRVVQGTRGRKVISSHIAGECFNGRVIATWKKQHDHMLGKSPDFGSSREFLNVGRGEVFASMLGCIDSRRGDQQWEAESFGMLSEALASIPDTIAEVRTRTPEHFERYEKEAGEEMLGQMLAVADGLLEGAFEEDEIVPDGATIDAGGLADLLDGHFDDDDIVDTRAALAMDKEASSAEAQPQAEPAGSPAMASTGPAAETEAAETRLKTELRLSNWSMAAYTVVMQQHRDSLKLLPHLLKTVSYTFGAEHGQVVALVFHGSAYRSKKLMEDIVWLGRLVNFVVALLCGDTFFPEERLAFNILAHKRKQLASIEVQDCHSLREGQLLTAVTKKGVETRVSYTYLGGGVTWQPPHTYPLVTRELSLGVADLLMAVFVCLCNTTLSRNMVVRKQNSNIAKRLSPEQKEAEITARMAAIAKHVAALQVVSLSPPAWFLGLLCWVVEG
jgi:hypothetical protein